MKLAALVLILQLPFSFCGWAEVWERALRASCKFSPHIEKLLPAGSRAKRSAEFEEEEVDFEDAEELFNYLYPLADMSPEEFEKESGADEQRSSSDASNTAYIWLIDLCHLWLAECHSRAGRSKNEEQDEMGSSTEVLEKSAAPEINYRSGNTSYASGRMKRTTSLSYSSSAHSGSQRSSSAHTKRRGTSSRKNPSTRPRFYKPKSPGSLSRLDSNVTTTTTAAPPPAEETFFSSYGGDIEYFFPLISFGIPFDGEITFLGFHGFKGLFPY